MPWLILFVAGLLEAGWAVGLRTTDGFTRPLPSLLTGSAIVGSMVLLAIAMRDLPVGTAYAVWVGIGVIGTAVAGIVFYDEPATAARLAFLGLLAVAIAGLRFTGE